MTATKIIIVDDDCALCEQTVEYLSLSGFDVVGVGSAAELYRRLAVEDFAIIVLDVRLPDEDGLSIATHIRKSRNVGIIMATASGETADRILGYEAGADLYLTKPIDFKELVAAVNNLTQRIGAPSAPDRNGPNPKMDSWLFDQLSYTLKAPNGKPVRLTSNEVSLLALFARSQGSVVARGDLLSSLGYDPQDPSNRNLDAGLRRLRLKTESQTGVALPLRAVHAVGYVFEAGLQNARI